METICKSITFATITTIDIRRFKAIKSRIERVATQHAFEVFRPSKLQVPPSIPKFAKGFPFEFELGRIMV
jgi:hypothetical protein